MPLSLFLLSNSRESDPQTPIGPSISSRAGKARPIRALVGVAGVIAIAGATAGLLGIGGALLFNPWLLQLGVHPQVRLCVRSTDQTEGGSLASASKGPFGSDDVGPSSASVFCSSCKVRHYLIDAKVVVVQSVHRKQSKNGPA
jgi:hypothetical protein